MDNSKRIYRFTYKWMDDSTYNRGYSEGQEGYYIGTNKEFEEMRKDLQKGFGFDCWDIKKTTATKDDLREREYWK